MIQLKQQDRCNRLKKDISHRILVLDGAMGTTLQKASLKSEDFGGSNHEGCNEHLVLTRPDIIKNIHLSYLSAGCDIIETNTFGGTPIVLNEFELAHKTYEINRMAAEIARNVADNFSTSNHLRYVAGAIGPTTKAISVTGGISFDELIHQFYVQAIGLFEGGVDFFLIETCQDGRNIKAALLALDKLFEEKKESRPIAVSGTVEPMGTLLAGQSVEALATSLAHLDLLYLGLNCATGPEFMTDHIRTLAEISPFPVACVPNAGLPDENGRYLETPEMMARILSRFAEQGWVNLIGGCCGTQAEHIQSLSLISKKFSPRKIKPSKRCFLSGLEVLEVTEENRPVLVGERTNVIGSRKFKDLICQEKFDEASEIAKTQVKNGAQIVDICLANPDRNELSDTEKFLEQIIKKVKVPFMIDSTDDKVIARALTYCQGKAIINSINLEEGEERFKKICPLAKKFGAALVVGTIDDHPEQGMAISRERKLEIARKSYELLHHQYQIPESDIYWDPLVFPCGTGDTNYIGSALETIEGLRLIKKELPKTKTVLGISNVSFGLPTSGREVLNSVFLYHCVQAGLDLAIVNSEKMRRFNTILPEELKLCENLLFNHGKNPLSDFVTFFQKQKAQLPPSKKEFPLEERLKLYIIEGTKEGLTKDLDLALKKNSPLEIINGPLMEGMNEVGKLFNLNKLIVAEVLQSAESMKAAVDHLQKFMTASDNATIDQKKKMLLATVKGDVHDIGKNLVEIILSNNGFEVIDLGIKIPPEILIKAIKEHKPDLIGLSGLLVKSAHQMVATAQDLSAAQIIPPMLVGGAALTSRFVENHIDPAYKNGMAIYAKDAMNALELAKKIVGAQITVEKSKERKSFIEPQVNRELNTQRSSAIQITIQPPSPSDYEPHILLNTPLDLIWKFVNPLMLYHRHLGISGPIVKKLIKMSQSPQVRVELLRDSPKAVEVWDLVSSIMKEYRHSRFLQPKAIYQHFHALSEGNKISLFENPQKLESPLATFEFLRQPSEDQLCLADYLNPRGAPLDNLALFVVSVGMDTRTEAERLRKLGEYLKSVVLQVLAIETAEAYAEFLHAKIRKFWGIMDSADLTFIDLFRARYQGRRFSFGYPACPEMEPQKIIFDLLKPEKIGVELTEGFMMDPEASVSALVFHHHQAKYFGVGGKTSQQNRNLGEVYE